MERLFIERLFAEAQLVKLMKKYPHTLLKSVIIISSFFSVHVPALNDTNFAKVSVNMLEEIVYPFDHESFGKRVLHPII